jgi:uncharacterized protein YqeY
MLFSNGEDAMRESINAALKDAMKAQDRRRVSTLRLMSAAIKDRDIVARGEGKGQATEEELLQLLAKMIRQRQESAKIYEDAGRAELAAAEREEIAIIESYLPKQLGEAEMREAIASVVKETGAGGVKDIGRVMAALKARYAGRMDFGQASGMVKEHLQRG